MLLVSKTRVSFGHAHQVLDQIPVWGFWILMTYGVVTGFYNASTGCSVRGEISHALQLEDL
ncbi:hypothetical protein SLEP1_g47239 [Rubroshorea leprosula]|uniref:Uncharacterized protein n=1 Tax=Rubroshorea leprosula TaxID=152421 RepID=A0AAV5LQ01_9ROSI|nr:hypothetical protein SLEP1_g47239 [Rubroshorea leprosula]